MRKVFVDTSAWVALFDEDDGRHHDAVMLIDELGRQRRGIVISDYVLSECITTVLGRAGHRIAVTMGEHLMRSAIIHIIWLDHDLKLRAWEYFKRHDDKQYSFTDCTSFVLMKEMRITSYLSFDDHFKQAGFKEFSK